MFLFITHGRIQKYYYATTIQNDSHQEVGSTSFKSVLALWFFFCHLNTGGSDTVWDMHSGLEGPDHRIVDLKNGCYYK